MSASHPSRVLPFESREDVYFLGRTEKGNAKTYMLLHPKLLPQTTGLSSQPFLNGGLQFCLSS